MNWLEVEELRSLEFHLVGESTKGAPTHLEVISQPGESERVSLPARGFIRVLLEKIPQCGPGVDFVDLEHLFPLALGQHRREQAGELKETNPLRYHQLEGLGQLHLDRYEQAYHHLKQALELKPEPAIEVALLRAAERAGRWKDWDLIIEASDRDHAVARFRRDLELALQKDPAGPEHITMPPTPIAEELEWIEVRGHPWIAGRVSEFEMGLESSRWRKAANASRAVRRLLPWHHLGWQMKGRLAVTRNRAWRAARAFHRALQLHPSDPVSGPRYEQLIMEDPHIGMP